ncbi:MAG: ABC transporter ATP-binding protein [Rhodospirillales bacterium]
MSSLGSGDRYSIEVQRVTKIFGSGASEVRAVDDVSINIRENEFLTLLGPSGCGKTTLLRMIAGFDHPTAGQILLDGEDISQLPPYQRPVNTVFQSYALFPHMTVAQNIGFGLEMQDKPKDEVRDTVERMLSLVRMNELRDRRTDQISGGQQQRVALARALAPHPKVLLLDEPLSALDYKLRKDMQIELKRLQNETGITFVFVTHDQEEALTMSDRVAVMSQGKILQLGSPRDIYDHPAERFVADFIGDTNFLSANVISSEGRKVTLKLDAGKKVTADLPEGIDVPAVGQNVTAVVRPEHANLAPAGSGQLSGTLANVVYVGTDTHYYVKLRDDSMFVARIQNSRDSDLGVATGQDVDVTIENNSVQVLRD